MNLIGLSGKAGSGKDTVADIINHITENRYEIKRFAGKLKAIASLLTGIPEDNFNKQEVKSSRLGDEWGGMTVREFLIRLGTEAVRNQIHNDAWVNALFADFYTRIGSMTMDLVSYPIPVSPSWIVADVRFDNEFQAIKKHGGIIIRIEREGIERIDHPSETSLDGHQFDFTIHNNGSIDELIEKVNNIMNALKNT